MLTYLSDLTPASRGRFSIRTMTQHRLMLPFPPSLNRAYRAAAGRVLLSKPARQYAIAVRNALPAGRVERLEGRLTVLVRLHPPERLARGGRWDVANREKLLCDSLTKAGFWRDDSQIDELTVVRGEHDAGYPLGAAFVVVTEILS